MLRQSEIEPSIAVSRNQNLTDMINALQKQADEICMYFIIEYMCQLNRF